MMLRLFFKATTFIMLTAYVVSGCGKQDMGPGTVQTTQYANGLLYLSPAAQEASLYFQKLDTSSGVLVSSPEKKVMDYAANSDGSMIILSYWNDLGGSDLFLLNQPGQEELIIDCGQLACINPVISPDGGLIIYQQIERFSDQGGGQSVLLMYDLDKREKQSVIEGQEINGVDPEFSFDGQYLVFQQLNPFGMVVLDIASQEVVFRLSSDILPGAYEWAGNAEQLFFITEEINNDLPITLLWSYDLDDEAFNEVNLNPGDNATITNLKVSPDEKYAAVSIKTSPFSPEQQIWVYDLEENTFAYKSNDQTASFGNISWINQGAVIFQRFSLSGEVRTPSIGIWELTKNRFSYEAENAYKPSWIGEPD